MRDWQLEQVVREDGAPSRNAIRGYLIEDVPQFRDSAEHLRRNCEIHRTVGMSRVLPFPNPVVYEMVSSQIVCVSIITHVFCNGEP
jgi:hypothetical protein